MLFPPKASRKLLASFRIYDFYKFYFCLLDAILLSPFYLLVSLNSVSHCIQWTSLNFGSSWVMFPRGKSRVPLSSFSRKRDIFSETSYIVYQNVFWLPFILLTGMTTCLGIVFVLQLFLNCCHFVLLFSISSFWKRKLKPSSFDYF